MGRLRRLRQRNGDVVPFRAARIAAAIGEAVRACGRHDPVLCDELAGVVLLFLEKRFDDNDPPTVDDVDDMIQQVLTETGHVRIARTFARLQRRDADSVETADALDVTVVRESHGLTARWNRARVVSDLVNDTEVSETIAAAVAVAVEQRIRAGGLRRIPAAVVRELIDGELVARGEAAALARHRIVGMPRVRVDELFERSTVTTTDPESEVARRVLEPWTLDAVHDASVRRAHADGIIHVFGAGTPQRVERVTLDATGPLFPVAATPDRFLLGVSAVLQAVRPLVRRGVVLARFSEAAASIEKRPGPRGIRSFVREFLQHLARVDVHGRSLFPPVTLEIHLGGEHLVDRPAEDARFVGNLARTLLAELEDRRALRDRLGLDFALVEGPDGDWPPSESLGRLLAAARRHRGVGLSLLRHGRTSLAGGETSSVNLEVGAVAINVPLALALHDVRSLEDVVGALQGPLRLASDALFDRYWFLRRTAPETLRGLHARLPGGGGLQTRADGQGAAILLWGLPYAVEMLIASGVISRDRTAEALAKIFACTDYLGGEERERVRLSVKIGGVTEFDVRARLLAAFQARAAREASAAASAALAGVETDATVLPLGSPLLDDRNAPFLQGTFLERLGPGLPVPARGEDEVVGAAWLKKLFKETRLGYVQLEERGDCVEVQEPLFGEA